MSSEDLVTDLYCESEEDVEFCNVDDSDIIESIPKVDPEYFDFECLTTEDVERLLNKDAETVCANLPVSPSIAKILLRTYNWKTKDIISKYKEDNVNFLADSKVKPICLPELDIQVIHNSKSITCPICLQSYQGKDFEVMACGHYFCKECWDRYFDVKIFQNVTTEIECMEQGCDLLVPEDFVLSVFNKSPQQEKFQQFAFSNYVKSHPQLRYCPGPECNLVVYAKESQSKRVICNQCKSMFCFKCGEDYHAPTDCDTMKKWIIKCAGDSTSTTLNYISAHTKLCPNCGICIEKSGGCNRVQCSGCKFNFCWQCQRDWKVHGTDDDFDCSQNNENPDIVNESAQGGEALKNYLFYFRKWGNHSKSLLLEEQTLQEIKDKANSKEMADRGSWIDWQYWPKAVELLAKCRYTLKYTYPFAYYMESSNEKMLFEFRQAQLETEIENLSRKIERIESIDRADLEKQMGVAEKWRSTLLGH